MSEYQRHICNFQNDGIRIENSRSHFHEEFTWQLVISREATESDLENNHHLENVGDEIWSAVVEINNCPFCGKNLREEKINNGEFSLFDSTGFSVDIL
jgi:hypothetical protein